MGEQSSSITICLAGVPICYAFRYPGTEQYFMRFQCAEQARAEVLSVTDEIWERHRNVAETSITNEYAEFYALLGITSRALLRHGKCLFHGTAFVWREKAWIITAPSGTGKTTQLRLWEKLYGNEISLINGDKPVIECRSDETMWVYPSPWNGKENLFGTASGKLGGIIVLEQAGHNEMQRMSVRECMIPIYRQFLYYGDYENEISAVGHMQDVILRNIPVWKLRNLGDAASAALTHDALLRYLEE